MPVYMINDEGERMNERKNEEGVGDPSVEYLQPLVRNAGEERDPVRLARRCTEQC